MSALGYARSERWDSYPAWSVSTSSAILASRWWRPRTAILRSGSGMGEPFAVSNRCRHLFAVLGKGRVAEDCCLECPWHGARYDVRSGKMTRGPQGAFRPLAGVVKGTTGSVALKTYPVELRDGEIWLK